MSLETMTKISTVTVGAGGSASISFSNIPQGYTDLVLKLSTRTTASGWTTTGLVLTLNGSSASVYSRRTLYNTSAGSAGSDSTSSTTSFVGGIVSCGASATSNTFGTANIYIPNYSDFNSKNISVESVSENNGTDTAQTYTFGLFANPSPITSLTLIDANGGSFVQHSIATLYGVKDTIKTAGNSIKATGGNIVFDGTYVYHVFPSSGAFTPTQALTADVLVVAGGGGGGHATGGQAGGGGAGGLLTFTSQSLGATSYTCTVGAGGAVASANNLPGSNGGNSQFGGLTACVGGGGAGSGNGPTGVSGGSGGGGASVDSGTSTPGTGTAGQGNNGGAGNGAPNYAAGGGGGAGAVGGSASGGNAGSGGIGATSALINGIGLATGVGQLSSGNYYFAGGGAGINGVSPTTTPTGGLGGGGASITAGTAYTGGGGGGRASGGSGIVIIRYKG